MILVLVALVVVFVSAVFVGFCWGELLERERHQ